MSSYNAFADVYDRLTDNVEYKKRADYICKLFKKYEVADKASVLDLACGTGSLTLELAKFGYDMIAVDISPDMLAQAQNKIFENNLSALVLCQDMTQLDLYGTVDACICTLDSLNHLDNAAAVEKAISKVGLFMNPGGIFIFDMNTIYKHRHVLANNSFVYDCDDVYCVWQNTLHDDDSVDICLDIFEYDDGAYLRSGEEFTEHAYPIENVIEWLKKAEFEIVELFDEETNKEPCTNSQRIIFVAKYNGKEENKNNG